jgi:hypothetical protein
MGEMSGDQVGSETVINKGNIGGAIESMGVPP